MKIGLISIAEKLPELISGRWLLSVLLIVTASWFSGCASSSSESLDSLLNQNDPVATGEFSRAARLFDRLAADGYLIEMDEVDAYLAAVLSRLYPDQHHRFAIRIARLPGENAFALSTGTVIVHLSLLAALENEHQLAFVLAHEFEHINARHGYLGAHLRRNARVKAHLADLLTLGSGKPYQYFAQGLQQVNREQELEADRRAAEVLKQAGFDITRAAQFFDVLKDYADPTQMLRKTGTHPDNQMRKEHLLEIASHGSDVDSIAAVALSSRQALSYQPLRQQILGLSIKEKIADLDFFAALVQIEALKNYPAEQARIHCLAGEIYHQMAVINPGSYADIVLVNEMRKHAGFDLPVVFTDASSRAYFLNRATTEYLTLQKLQPDSACAARGLGQVFLTMGEQFQARQHLRQYLRLKPAAFDRRYILDLLSTSAAI